MRAFDCRVGMKVRFGRPNGEQTLGEVVKCNPARAKVRCLDSRGAGRGSAVGTVWNVPYSMMSPVEAGAAEVGQPAGQVATFDMAPRPVVKLTHNGVEIDAPWNSFGSIEEATLYAQEHLSPSSLIGLVVIRREYYNLAKRAALSMPS